MQKDNPPVMLDYQFPGKPRIMVIVLASAAQSVYSRYPDIVKGIWNIDPELLLEPNGLSILKG
jgi:hypothetical protein